MGWDGSGGGPRTDLEGLGWYERSGMSLRDLGWVKRAWDWYGGSKVGVKGQGIVWGPKDGQGRPDIGVKGFGWVLRA